MHASYLGLLSSYTVKEELRPIIQKMLQNEIANYMGDGHTTLKTLHSRWTEVNNKIQDVEYKYALSEIPKSAYDVAKKRLYEELSEITHHIEELEMQLSNTFPSIDKMVLMCCKLSDLWKKSNFKERQQLQNLVFPNGVRYSRLLANYRTPNVNKVFALMHDISESYDREQTKNDFELFSKSSLVEKT